MTETPVRPNPPGSGFQTLGEGRQSGADPLLVLQLWWNSVGLHIARNAHPTGIHHRSLLVTVPEDRWRQHLEGMRAVLLERIRQQPGGQRIRDLLFQAGPEGVSGSPGFHRPLASSQAIPTPSPEIFPDAPGISEPSLRDRFLRTARKYLARGRQAESPSDPGS